MKALASPTAKFNDWALAPRDEVLPSWHRRGRAEEMGADEGELIVVFGTEAAWRLDVDK